MHLAPQWQLLFFQSRPFLNPLRLDREGSGCEEGNASNCGEPAKTRTC